MWFEKLLICMEKVENYLKKWLETCDTNMKFIMLFGIKSKWQHVWESFPNFIKIILIAIWINTYKYHKEVIFACLFVGGGGEGDYKLVWNYRTDSKSNGVKLL